MIKHDGSKHIYPTTALRTCQTHPPPPPHAHTISPFLCMTTSAYLQIATSDWDHKEEQRHPVADANLNGVSAHTKLCSHVYRRERAYPLNATTTHLGHLPCTTDSPPRGMNGGCGGKKTKERHHYGCDCDLAWTEVGQTLHYQQFTFSSFKQPSSIALTSTLSLSSPPSIRLNLRAQLLQASARSNWWRNNRRETTLSKQRHLGIAIESLNKGALSVRLEFLGGEELSSSFK